MTRPRSPESAKTSRIRVLGAAACAAALAFIAWWFGFRETPGRAGGRLIGCVQARDAACVLGYMTEEERKVLQIDEPSMQAYLDQIVGPAIAASEPVSGMSSKRNDIDSSFFVYQLRRRKSDQTEVSLTFAVYELNGSFKADSLVRSLFNFCSSVSASGDGARAVQKRLYARQNLERLKATGVRGFAAIDDNEGGRLVLRTWEEYIASPP